MKMTTNHYRLYHNTKSGIVCRVAQMVLARWSAVKGESIGLRVDINDRQGLSTSDSTTDGVKCKVHAGGMHAGGCMQGVSCVGVTSCCFNQSVVELDFNKPC